MVDYQHPSSSGTMFYTLFLGFSLNDHEDWVTCPGYSFMRIIKLNLFSVPLHLHSGYGILIFVIISPCFAILKNVVHSLEPGETPSCKVSKPVAFQTLCVDGAAYS